MSRQLELLNGVALLITAASLVLMSVLALPAAVRAERCATPFDTGASVVACARAER